MIPTDFIITDAKICEFTNTVRTDQIDGLVAELGTLKRENEQLRQWIKDGMYSAR